MEFEVGYLNDRGEITRGGVYADVRTVARWIAQAMEDDPYTTFFAVPANADAVSIKDLEKEYA